MTAFGEEIPGLESPKQPGDVRSPAPDPHLRLHTRFHSRFLPDDRDVIVYLPPGYEEQPDRRFPALYMSDGQNLFDPATSFIKGRTWQMRETADRLILDGEIEPLIIVGIYNSPHRLEEYTHARDHNMRGGNAGNYGRMVVRELKPFIDGEYRTLAGTAHTALGGSSLGGLVTLYLGLKHTDTFFKLAVFSPSVWWNHKSIIGYVNDYEGPPFPRIWLSMGSDEGRRAQPDVDLLYKRLVANGWRPEIDVHYERIAGGTHDETAWAGQVAAMLRFLFPVE